MKVNIRNTRRYRMYVGKGNWINLGEKATQDLLRIYEEGKAVRYELAPGLALDIMPDDVDCNTKNTGLPRLMRADLHYEDGDEDRTQQALSNYVKSLLEEQGILDAFIPARKQGDSSLPRVSEVPTHRHLSMVPAPIAMTRRASRSSSSSNQTTPLASEQTSPAVRKRRPTLTRRAKAASSRESDKSSWPGAPSSSGLPLNMAGSPRPTGFMNSMSVAADDAAAAAAAAAAGVGISTSGFSNTTVEVVTASEAQQHSHHHHPIQDTHSYFSSASSSLYTSPHLLGPRADQSAGSNDASTASSWSDRHAPPRGLFRRATDASTAALGLHFEQDSMLDTGEEPQNLLIPHHSADAAVAAAVAAVESQPATPWLWHDPSPQHQHHQHHHPAYSSGAQHSLAHSYYPNQPVYLHHIPYSLENFQQQGSMHLIQHNPSYQTTPDEEKSAGSSLAEDKAEHKQDYRDDSSGKSP
ncbi:hypothetical protein BCR43DRAFT_536158 [Syncephalastrum racemosum]|uniref:Uncharacterized protein n=1 Tax=Syncephalastrum racemosum TaxID=13706 RepID=A0A1X2HVP6_SYNRA|nr:hypothetical protein BCR43DRAFT_536158 [Syncephalastrum racemosum]